MLSRKKILWSMIALLAAVALVVGGTAVGQAVVSPDEPAAEADLDTPAPPEAEEAPADSAGEPADAPANRSSRRRRPRSTAQGDEAAADAPADASAEAPPARTQAAAAEPAALEPGQPAVRQGVPAWQPLPLPAGRPAAVATPVRPPAAYSSGPRTVPRQYNKTYRAGEQSGTYVVRPSWAPASPLPPNTGYAPASPYSPTYPSTGRPGTRYVYSGYIDDPALGKLVVADSKMEKEAQDLAGQFRQATDDQKRTELRAALEELSKKHFEVRQERRQFEVSQLEKRLESIRAAIEKRNQAQELIIRRRVAQLLGEEDELAF